MLDERSILEFDEETTIVRPMSRIYVILVNIMNSTISCNFRILNIVVFVNIVAAFVPKARRMYLRSEFI